MKTALKLVAHTVAIVLVSPLLGVYSVGSLVLGKDRALEGASQTLALLPGISGMFLRRAFLGVVLARCHRSSEICFGTLFSQVDAIIDENVYVGPRCHLGWVHLERDVLIAAGVHIPSGAQTHHFDDPRTPIRQLGGARSMVTIGAGAWVGSAAVVMADVGRGSIIAAGSVVTKPVPENVIAGGVPAKVIRGRFEKRE
jgi:acetyltransferase-like isoleucine patch superfamily enzyme